MDESTLHSIFWDHLAYPDLASGEVDDPSVTLAWMRERLPDGRWPEYAVCVAVDGLHALDPATRRYAVTRIREAASASLLESQCLLLGFAHTNAVYFCGCVGERRDALMSRLANLNGAIRATLGLPSTVGVAFLRDETLEGLQWAAQRAIVAQRQKVCHGANRVYVYDDSIIPTSLDLGAYWSLAKRAQTVVRRGDEEATRAVMVEVARALFEDRYLSLAHLRPILQSQVVFMAQAATDAAADADSVARQSEAYLSQIATCFDYARLREVLGEAALCFAGLVHERHKSQADRLVIAVDECITVGLTNPDLGLHLIAAQLGASPAHISRTYKKAKGQGVTRSINGQRVDRAKLMLRDPRHSVSDVAYGCGFGSIQHFGRVFKEITGSAPSAFRQPRFD